jgi:hypothetical protein
MTIQELFAKLSVKVLCEGEPEREISRGVTGDLLSFIMGNAPESSAWVTILGHINVAAVAVLRGIPCIIVAAGKTPDPQMIFRCTQEGIALGVSEESAFSLCARMGALGLKG